MSPENGNNGNSDDDDGPTTARRIGHDGNRDMLRILGNYVIESREFLVEVHARSRNWEPLILRRPDDLIEMPEFGLRCVVGDLYLGTPLDPERGG